MSLIRWYRMNGNIIDAMGNSELVNSGTSTAVAGKIGQAMRKTSGYYLTDLTNIPDNLSISLWYKHNGATWASECIFGTRLGSNGFMLYRNASDTAGYYRAYFWYNSTSSTIVGYNQWPGISGLSPDTWYHLVMTRDSLGNFRLYKDGTLIYNGSPPSDFVSWNNNGATLAFHAQGNGSGYTAGDISFNDVRIYDHALSPKEVKELAKAKILHYKFDDMQEPTENLIHFQNPRIDDSYDPYVATTSGTWQAKHPDAIRVYNNSGSEITSYVNQGVTDWTNTYHAVWTFDNELKKPVVTMRDLDGQWKAKSFSMGKSMNSLGLKVGDKYTISWLQWTDTPGKRPLVGLYGQNSSGSSGFHDGQGYGQISKANVWERLSHTFTVGSSWNMSANLTLYMYGHYQGRGTLKIADVQMEIKDHATEFIDSHSRTGTVHDSSGYDNHAELALATTPRWVGKEESKIGSGAYEFDGTNTFIMIPEHVMDVLIQNSFSISFWLYSNNVTGLIRDVLGGGNYGHSTGGVAFSHHSSNVWYYDIYIENVGRVTTTIPQSSIPFNQWNHITLSRDRDSSKIAVHVNGELAGENINALGLENINWNKSVYPLKIGKGYYNSTDGIIDDVRIYATALSDEDIKELYQTRGSIDSHGNLYVQDIKEHDTYRKDIENANLVENGDQEYGNNYNFSAFEYRESENCLSITSGSSTVMTSNFIKVQGNGLDSFDRYRLDCYIKGENIRSRFYFMIICYDKYFREINHRQVGMYANTATTLSQALNPGDTWVYMQDISNWQDDGTTNYAHTKSLALWHPNDEKPLLTPYKYTRRTFNVVEVDKTNNRVRLQNPYSGDVIPAGSPACNTRDGSTYPYIGGSNQWTDLNEWKYMSGLSTSSDNLGGMRFGSSYVRVGYLINREATGGTPTTLIKNIRFYNIDNCQNPTLEYSGLSRGVLDNGEYATNVFSEVGPIDGIIGWWPLDGHTQDYSGNNNHGTNNGATITSGIRGSAYSFDGSADQFIDISGHGLHLSEMYNGGATFSCWVYPLSHSTVIAQNIAGFLYFTINSSGKLQNMIRNVADNVNYWVYGKETIPLNKWSHVVCVVENGVGGRYYLNGELDGVGNNVGVEVVDRATSSRLGFYNASSLDGKMCDARIYNRALSPEEIKILYDVTKPNATPMQLSNDGTVYLSGELKEA